MQRFQSIEDLEAMLGANLSPAEQKLIIICSQPSLKGVVYDFGGPVDGGREASLEPGRQIRTEILLHCLYDLFETWSQRNRLFKIAGAQIVGELPFLADSRIAASIIFDSCVFQADIEAPRLKVDGDLIFKNCHIQYLDLSGAKIEGDLSFEGLSSKGRLNGDGCSLRLQNTCVGGALFIRKSDTSNSISGVIDLTAASVGSLIDDAHYCSGQAQYILAGFTYDRLGGAAPKDAKNRLTWLAMGDTWQDHFSPQPYKQLAKVLCEMGHEEEATQIRVVLGKKLRHHARKERIANAKHPVPRLLAMATTPALWIWYSLSLLLTGHGFRPERSLIALVFLWGLATIPAHLAWKEGSFAPNSAVALQSESWAIYSADHNHPPHPNPAKDWSLTSTIGRDWESFNRYAYAADLVVPIIDLGQTDAWAPSTSREFWGWHLWWARWFFTLFGWIVTALGAAALTGIIRRE
ncbi:hypothetical protein [Phaeobacter gallaeciensis]|uniref:hypothetical protein n=1 Tax=Phaeobacter gallaeciensis TaxID=60890 RepID=UPI000BBF8D8D|nr:hypothetical protein [Phaeobacter gallaeciensis]ATF19320.1 hypothetical protein PhaeoP129_02710 [Phaeobacter gallaeciensis]ATF23429.1 hypothetical protein PhaeoP128_02711 [Phaeobacter gallaeciensis]